MKAAQPETIDQYIAPFPPAVRKLLQKVRLTIRKVAPGAVETITYRIPTFRLGGNLVHFAAFDHHIGFYPTASGIAAFEDALSGYVHARGSVQFPLDAPIPFDLITRITEFRVNEVLAKQNPKPSKPPKAVNPTRTNYKPAAAKRATPKPAKGTRAKKTPAKTKQPTPS